MSNEKITKEHNKMVSQKGRSRKTKRSTKVRDDSNQVKGELDTNSRLNNPDWYFLEKEIADQASSFSFGSYIGEAEPFSCALANQATVSKWESPINIPSILTIYTNPSPGDTSTVTNGINMAALKTYSTLSSQNAKTTNYAPQDLTMLMLYLGEVISMIEHVRRAFGYAFTYNQRNRDLPRKLLEAMGFDADDFLKSLANHRLQFNSWITAINKVPFLSNISYLYKCADMYQNVFTDSESPMAQLILMRPYTTWQLDELSYEEGTVLKTKDLPDKGLWADWANIIEKMVEDLFTSATYNYIYSDVLNYSNKTGAKLLYLDYLTESYVLAPIYNGNFLMQIHNAVILNAPQATYDDKQYDKANDWTYKNDVIPDADTNKIIYKPLFGTATSTEDLLLDMPTGNPSVEDRIEATRYMCLLGMHKVTHNSGTGYRTRPQGIPDHYVVKCEITTPIDGTGSTLTTNAFVVTQSNMVDYTWATTASQLSQFDWAPLLYMTRKVGDSRDVTHVFGDLNFYTSLDYSWFKRVNDLVFQALFTLR